MALSLESLPLREVISIHQPEVAPSPLPLEPSDLRVTGRRINYYDVSLRVCTSEHTAELVSVLSEVETRAFESEFGSGTADTPEELQFVLEQPDAVLYLAVDRGDDVKSPKVVGLLCGIPASAYALERHHVTDDTGQVHALPSSDTFYLHTLAVLPEDRNRKVGYNLWKLFQKEVFPPYGKWKSLALFAAFRKQDSQAYLNRLLEREFQLTDPKEQWRILSKGDIRTYLDEYGTRQNRLIPVCYILLDMRGKYEKDLMVISSISSDR